ncbi:MAG: 3-hydroxyacyl-CoA dehydrogenase family protein [Chloroflexi bacterium]|nr:3-hydroxyacyl-CoA dehydrogenase family protein [Chloroflexota bacterium]
MDKQDLIDRFIFAQFIEACHCLEEGIAPAKDIDLAMRIGAGLKEGPLAWADSVGLDAIFWKLKALSARHGARFAPPALLQQMVEENRLGVKTGKGFHDYAS